jgi:hypothetical protein
VINIRVAENSTVKTPSPHIPMYMSTIKPLHGLLHPTIILADEKNKNAPSTHLRSHPAGAARSLEETLHTHGPFSTGTPLHASAGALVAALPYKAVLYRDANQAADGVNLPCPLRSQRFLAPLYRSSVHLLHRLVLSLIPLGC